MSSPPRSVAPAAVAATATPVPPNPRMDTTQPFLRTPALASARSLTENEKGKEPHKSPPAQTPITNYSLFLAHANRQRMPALPYWERPPKQVQEVLSRARTGFDTFCENDPLNQALLNVRTNFAIALDNVQRWTQQECSWLKIEEVVHAQHCAEVWERHERMDDLAGQLGRLLAYVCDSETDEAVPVEFLLRAAGQHLQKREAGMLEPLRTEEEEEAKRLIASGQGVGTPEWDRSQQEWGARRADVKEKVAAELQRTRRVLRAFAEAYGSELEHAEDEQQNASLLENSEMLEAARDPPEENAALMPARKRARDDADDADTDEDQAHDSKRARTIPAESSAATVVGAAPILPMEIVMERVEVGPSEPNAHIRVDRDVVPHDTGTRRPRSDEDDTELGPRRKKARTCYALCEPAIWLARTIFRRHGPLTTPRVRQARTRQPMLPATASSRATMNMSIESPAIDSNAPSPVSSVVPPHNLLPTTPGHASARTAPALPTRPLYTDNIHDREPVRQPHAFSPNWWGNEDKMCLELDLKGDVLREIVNSKEERAKVVAAKAMEEEEATAAAAAILAALSASPFPTVSSSRRPFNPKPILKPSSTYANRSAQPAIGDERWTTTPEMTPTLTMSLPNGPISKRHVTFNRFIEVKEIQTLTASDTNTLPEASTSSNRHQPSPTPDHSSMYVAPSAVPMPGSVPSTGAYEFENQEDDDAEGEDDDSDPIA